MVIKWYSLVFYCCTSFILGSFYITTWKQRYHQYEPILLLIIVMLFIISGMINFLSIIIYLRGILL